MRQRGFTALELVLTSALVGVLVVGMGTAWHFVADGTLKARDRAKSVTELRAAVDHLQQDLAGAARVEPQAKDRLRILHTADVQALIGKGPIEYALEEEKLVRRDLARKTSAVVALDVDEFVVTRLYGKQTEVRVAAGTGAARHAVTLRWER